MTTAVKALCISLIMLALTCVPAQAQLTSYADDRGNLVFINNGPNANNPDPAAGPIFRATPMASSPGSPARRTTPEELDRLGQQTAEKHRVDPRLVRAAIFPAYNSEAA